MSNFPSSNAVYALTEILDILVCGVSDEMVNVVLMSVVLVVTGSPSLTL